MAYRSDINYTAPEDWRAYSGVLSRRVFAFVIDYLLVAVLWVPAVVVVFFVGVVTLGLGFLLYPVLFFIVAGFYFGMSFAGPYQATPGMRAMGIYLVRLDGQKIDFVTAIAHLALFWLFNSVLTPLVLLVGLFTDRSRLLHDLLLGTAVARAY